ncbi:MAG TPA: PH domain-containing protein [Flavobacterium sp.]|mgnify:FL=1|uniref:PH domain-containing protein n=1 Tax=Flavobacterium sp. TaxID=239 RepID=UPI001B67E5D2|nr:PH domain-containing protein [Flavobacterium sp.]MBP6146432.1 PH domain-containing protein [Flavobacterium sp.]MBP7316803.1 PH domain-containing protein [Flavobacterium sp.]MBP8887995.1 PH domain-containing protein [Flavobacterium sp.]HRL71966.1 PH domain-containing protein [Flavobacterium sp.]HRM12729.1 PH domain-containing protein [Flavobacterium sp.]
MENFTNETLDTSQLPKFEEVAFTALHPKYLLVVLIGLLRTIAMLVLIPTVVSMFKPEFFSGRIWLILGIIIPIFSILLVVFSSIGFKKKGFAFREHDVLYRYGIIATNTIVIPYNRVQHVALHEGLVSRYFGLAKIEIFTAGGSSSDIEIPGIEKEQAENIKQLLMGKIQKQL